MANDCPFCAKLECPQCHRIEAQVIVVNEQERLYCYVCHFEIVLELYKKMYPSLASAVLARADSQLNKKGASDRAHAKQSYAGASSESEDAIRKRKREARPA